jgi:hypothetical protein
LDHRSHDGLIEFLVRYRDNRIPHDIWVKSTDLTCYHKILAHYDRTDAPNVQPRLQGKGITVLPIPPEDHDSGITVVDIEATQGGDIYIVYQMSGDRVTRHATRGEFAQLYRTQLNKYMMETYGKR